MSAELGVRAALKPHEYVVPAVDIYRDRAGLQRLLDGFEEAHLSALGVAGP